MRFSFNLTRVWHVSVCTLFFIVGIMAFLSYGAVAKSVSKDQGWSYDADIGFEGQAFITNEASARIEMECGNGGGPAIMIMAPSVSQAIAKVPKDIFLLTFDISGQKWSETYKCSVSTSRCDSMDFPSIGLIKALRQGQNVTIWLDQSRLTTFSLTGSYAAISHLSSCLG